jgi:hypothetical protein
MGIHAIMESMNDDPRRLRVLIQRAAELASDHSVPSVLVGLKAQEGDLCFPEFIEYLQAALRVEDGIFRMTRERVVLHLADVDRRQTEEVLQRLIGEFNDQYPSMVDADFDVRCVEVKPGLDTLSVKDVLTNLFAPPRYH